MPGNNPLLDIKFWSDSAITIHGTHGYARATTGNGWVAVTRSSKGEMLRGEGFFTPSEEQPLYIRDLCNVSTPEPVCRTKDRAYVKDRLALADEVGARCAITYIGSLAESGEFHPHPNNLTQKGFDEFVECAREIIDSVKPNRAKFCLEMMQ